MIVSLGRQVSCFCLGCVAWGDADAFQEGQLEPLQVSGAAWLRCKQLEDPSCVPVCVNRVRGAAYCC